MTESSEVSIEIAADRATVFRALTDRAALETWFAEHADINLTTGRYAFWGRHTPEAPGRETGRHRLISCDADREFAFDWHVTEHDSVVTVSLAPASTHTLVTVNQRRLPAGDGNSAILTDFWCLALQNLRSWVETGAAAWLPDFSVPQLGVVSLSVDAQASPEAVFASLLQPDLLDHWIATGATVEAKIGGTYDLGWKDIHGRPLKILNLEPNRRLLYSWADPDEQDTVVSWTLEGSAGATRITLVHSGFGDSKPRDNYYGGWADFLVRLKFLAEQGAAWRGPTVTTSTTPDVLPRHVRVCIHNVPLLDLQGSPPPPFWGASNGGSMAYGTGMAKGMGLTMRSMFRAPATIQYPEEVRYIPVYARTNLLWFEERCTGCSTCAQACPDGCILVATSQDAEGRRNIDRYEIDFRICMYCGLCTEACPYEAIQPGGPLDDAVYQFDEMYRDKHRLTEFAQVFLDSHENTYPNGMKAPDPDADFHRL